MRTRDHYLTMIANCEALTGEANSFLEKAQRLLTTHWGHATWAARQDILTSVEWLVRVGTATPAIWREGAVTTRGTRPH